MKDTDKSEIKEASGQNTITPKRTHTPPELTVRIPSTSQVQKPDFSGKIESLRKTLRKRSTKGRILDFDFEKEILVNRHKDVEFDRNSVGTLSEIINDMDALLIAHLIRTYLRMDKLHNEIYSLSSNLQMKIGDEKTEAFDELREKIAEYSNCLNIEEKLQDKRMELKSTRGNIGLQAISQMAGSKDGHLGHHLGLDKDKVDNKQVDNKQVDNYPPENKESIYRPWDINSDPADAKFPASAGPLELANSMYMQVRYNWKDAEANYRFVESDPIKSIDEKQEARAKLAQSEERYADYIKNRKNPDYLQNALKSSLFVTINDQLKAEIDSYIKSVDSHPRANIPLAKDLMKNWNDALSQLYTASDRFERKQALDNFIRCKYEVKDLVNKGVYPGRDYQDKDKLNNYGKSRTNTAIDPYSKG